MKDCMTLGRDADVAETAALTLVDANAERRMLDELDYEQMRKKRKNKIDSAMRRLSKWDRAFARAVLQGKSWRDMGIAKSTFSDSLKRIENLFSRL